MLNAPLHELHMYMYVFIRVHVHTVFVCHIQKPSTASQADSPVKFSSRRSPIAAVPGDIASLSAEFRSLLARFPDRRLPLR